MTKGTVTAHELRMQIDNEVTRHIRQHARSHMTTEVCGVLIGEKCNGVIEVRASIEALNAAQAGTHVTFTQDAWETIYRVKDESYPEERIIGWYHSHPGFGVFLSEHDTFIHQNFFSSPDQVAWVYDPHTDEEGCFGWIDGAIHRIRSISVVDNNGDGIERTPKEVESSLTEPDSLGPANGKRGREPAPAWRRRSITALSHLFALLLGFLIAYFLFPQFIGIPVDPATGEPLIQLSRPATSASPQQSPGTGGSPSSQPRAGAQPAQQHAPDTSSGRNK